MRLAAVGHGKTLHRAEQPNNPMFSTGSTNVTQNIRKIKLPARSSLIGSNAKGTVNSSNVKRYVAISSG